MGGSRKSGGGGEVRGSWACGESGCGGFQDEAGQVEQEREGIAEQGGLGRIGEAEPGGALQLVASLGGIAALGIGLPADAQFPGVGADLHVTGEADGAIRESQADGDGSTERTGGICEGAGAAWGLFCGGKRYIGVGLVNTFLSADPFSGIVLVIVAIARQAVAMRTERDAVLIVATLQAGYGQVIGLSMAEADGAQGVQIGVDIGQDGIIAFPGIAEHFADGESGETQVQVLQAGDGLQMVVAVGRSEGAGDRPEGEDAVVDDVEGFGFVTEMVFAVRSGRQFGVLGCIRVVAGLVGAGVEVIPNSG